MINNIYFCKAHIPCRYMQMYRSRTSPPRQISYRERGHGGMGMRERASKKRPTTSKRWARRAEQKLFLAWNARNQEKRGRADDHPVTVYFFAVIGNRFNSNQKGFRFVPCGSINHPVTFLCYTLPPLRTCRVKQ